MRALDVRVTIGPITMYSNPFVRENFYLLRNPDELLAQLRTDQSTFKKQAGHGVAASLPSYGPRTLPFAVEIHASAYSVLLAMEAALVNALTLPAYPSYNNDGSVLVKIRMEGGENVQIYAIPLERVQPTLSESQKRRLYTWSMFAKDPTLLSQTADSATGPEAFSTTNFTFQDGDLPTFQDGDLPTIQDTIGSEMTVTNEGNIGAPCIITIHGPTVNPIVTNGTSGKKIELSKNGGLTLATGERVEIDTSDSKSITKVDAGGVETDVSGTFSDDSEWFTVEPGANVFTLFDDTPGNLESQLAIAFRSAWQ